MNLTQVKYVDDKHKEFVRFCNSLRCPLCGMQLDGNIHPKKAELYCVGNNDEYKCRWFPDQKEPEMESIKYWYPQYEYVIQITRQGPSTYNTIINRYNLDTLPIYRASTRKEVFSYSGPRVLFFRRRMEEELFLKKLKTYNVFS